MKSVKVKNEPIRIRYNDWEIPQLIHHISSALESPTVDEFRDDKFFERMGEGRSGDSTEISKKILNIFRIAASSFPLSPINNCHSEFFHKKNLNYLTNPYLWKNEGSPRSGQIFESTFLSNDVQKDEFWMRGNFFMQFLIHPQSLS